MEKATLLVADDEADLLAELRPVLQGASFEVALATEGRQALDLSEQVRPDLVILDVLMPRLDGREVLRRLQQAGDWTPVILLTHVGTPAERAFSLQEGPDDYLNKPFEPLELITRVQAVLHRTRGGIPPLTSFRRLVSGRLVLDRRARRAWLGEQSLALTARAFGVLEYLMLHPHEIVSRERLLDEVWGWAYPVGTRVVDVRIAELRKALGDDAGAPASIETVVGQGYRFVREVEGQHSPGCGQPVAQPDSDR